MVGGNELVAVGDRQFACVLVVCVTERIDVPLVVRTVDFLNMSTDHVSFRASDGLAKQGCPSAEIFPVLEPRTAGAGGARHSVDVLDFHVGQSSLVWDSSRRRT